MHSNEAKYPMLLFLSFTLISWFFLDEFTIPDTFEKAGSNDVISSGASNDPHIEGTTFETAHSYNSNLLSSFFSKCFKNKLYNKVITKPEYSAKFQAVKSLALWYVFNFSLYFLFLRLLRRRKFIFPRNCRVNFRSCSRIYYVTC